MLFSEILEHVRRLFPSQFSDDDINMWCGEVSAMIANEDMLVLKEKVVPMPENREINIPDVHRDSIRCVRADNEILCPCDALSSDDTVRINGVAYILESLRFPETITVVYNAPVIDDETVCEAPYDSMYIDYVIAKLHLYQHDNDGYNRHITAFNSRLNSYKRVMASKLPKPAGRFRNWW